MNLKQLIGILSLLIFTNACQKQIERFNNEKPYAIIIEKYRSPREASNAQLRIKEMGIPVYMADVNEKETGRWYMLLTGAFNTLESAIAKRIAYEDDNSFLYLDIVNYNQVSKHELAFIEQFEEVSLPDSLESPIYSNELVEVLKAAPFSKAYRIEDVKLLQKNDSFDVLRRTSLKKNVFDMPRGVYPPALVNAADALAEIVYFDELIGLRYIVNVISLTPEHKLGADVSEVFAKKIIDTREYDFEEMLPKKINGKRQLTGYAVNIEPRKGKVFRYLVMQDLAGKFLYLIQSAKSSQENIEIFANDIAAENGLLSYEGLHEKLALLDAIPAESGSLCYTHYRRLHEVPGKTGAFIEKHTKTNFMLFHPSKGEWEFTASRYFDANSLKTVFTNVYTPYRRNKKDSVQVQQKHAWLTKLRRRNPDTRKYEDFPNEIQFANDKFIFVISNKKYARLDKNDMMTFLEGLNMSPTFTAKKDFWDGLLSN